MPFRNAVVALCLAVFALAGSAGAATQLLDPNATYRVSGGGLYKVDLKAKARADSLARARVVADSLMRAQTGADSLAQAAYVVDTAAVRAVMMRAAQTMSTHKVHTIGPDGKEIQEGEAAGGIHTAEQAETEGSKLATDSVHVRHNWLFRDSIPISRVTAISLVAPGFAQLYNNQPWKVPVLYGVVGTALYLGFRQNRTYQFYRRIFNDMQYNGAAQGELDPWQQNMIKHNTYRQLFFGAAIATYIYFIGDGVVNYPGAMTSVKKATTLSTICPGAGQVYNGKFWKLPIVVGGLATLAFTIDWNNRGYQRFKLAYNQVAAGKPDEFDGRYDATFLQNLRNNYRRNRDLCIILTGAFYLLNIIDAHVDSQLQDFDMSDNLAMYVTPYVNTLYASGRENLSLGLSFNVKF